MPRPRLTKKMTTREVARELGMTTETLLKWIKCEVLSPPTCIDKNGTRYFDQEWLKKAKAIVKSKRADE